MRRPIIAGNWKMNKTNSEAKELINLIKPLVEGSQTEVVICPTFLSLITAVDEVKGTNIKVGAQNMHWETSGAYTGEVSAEMLKEIGIKYVIIGHSERREYFNEIDTTVNKKVLKALESNLIPILCVGESLEERENGLAKEIVINQIKQDLKNVNDATKVVVAYEPIWAIGTGKTATSEQANEVCGWIRETLAELYDKDTSNKIRIQYGGSVKPNNVKELMSMEHIDGALVGGASLKADFADLVNFNK